MQPNNSSGPWWPSSKVSALGLEIPGSKADSTEAVYGACCTLNHTYWPNVQTCGVKLPTLARPTQEGCEAGRGPAGREPLPQHVEDGIYWVQ
ncbi:hypothetical protein AVEN_186775-1 [Araneus ventricosus]|uniref:Uncharacterized protein n=1 Tax=Araneus ventricosus TaxID=182803 RepID=A0A4Y2W7C6_ARAVE|nr:hypothetical protein AVEN_254971-1 [Araneus ventricosus]GBL98453.1 hypothetical protein AVEN_229244-1 [Araneus ventricosus]GBO33293.1 hypothetical protein AVEN_76023-1 [Araneus ventricosus]GBO33305.1 hypothetical protein AVEN_186775-1 [Araneus ventricosus]